MPKMRETSSPPKIEDIMEALGWTRSHGQHQFPGQSRQLLDLHGGMMVASRPCKNIREVARALKSSVYQVRRVLAIAKTRGKNGLLSARWGNGRPKKPQVLTKDMKDWALSDAILRN